MCHAPSRTHPQPGPDFNILPLPVQRVTADLILFLDLFRAVELAIKRFSLQCPECKRFSVTENLEVQQGKFNEFVNIVFFFEQTGLSGDELVVSGK